MQTITPQILLKAYTAGIFPMAENADDLALYWIDPERRGIIPLNAFHMSRSLRRSVRRKRFVVTVDTAFNDVVAGCAERTAERRSTWINGRIRSLYAQLHKMGFCHSVECWSDGRLAGGLYGVRIGGAFFGESMFTRAPDASKVALVHLVARLNAGEFDLLDSQFMNEHLKQFGTIEVPRPQYHEMLEQALAKEADFFRFPDDDDPEAVLALAGGNAAAGLPA